MRFERQLGLWLLLCCSACAPLLDADFDGLDGQSIANQVVDLPGAPNGDRMLAGTAVSLFDTGGDGDQALQILRNAVVDQFGGHGSAFFDPIDAGGAPSIFFTWHGNLFHTDLPDSDTPLIAVKLRDLLAPDQPNLFSKLTIRFGPDMATVALGSGADEIAIGDGVTGGHTAILRIDPGTNRYGFSLVGDGVQPGGGFSHSGQLPANTTIDPDNIGITLSFDDEINFGASAYLVDDVVISKRDPN